MKYKMFLMMYHRRNKLLCRLLVFQILRRSNSQQDFQLLFFRFCHFLTHEQCCEIIFY